MIVDKPFIYFASMILLSIFLLVTSSLLRLHQIHKFRVSEGLTFDASQIHFLFVLFGFCFYYYLPSDMVRDYISYAEHYIETSYGIYSASYNYFSSRDLLFFNYVEILSSLGVGYRFAYGAIVAFYIHSLVKLSKKVNAFPWLVILLALVFGNLYFIVSGLRQAAAMAFLLLAYSSYLEKRWFLVVIHIILAAGFHGSAILGVVIIALCIYFSNRKSLLSALILTGLLSFPFLWWQLQGFSLITKLMPYFAFLISDEYLRYGEAIQEFNQSKEDSAGFGFVFFTLAKAFFLLLSLGLNKKRLLTNDEQNLVFIAAFYILCFNIMGLNQFTHRLLNYLTPFLFMAMSLALTKYSSQNNVARFSSSLFIFLSGVLAVIVAMR